MSKVESENSFLSSLILTKLLSNPANGKSGINDFVDELVQ